MAESFIISCLKCGKKIKVGEEILGKKIRCKDCQTIFVATKPTAGASAKAKAPTKKEEAAATTEPGQQLSMKESFEKQLAEEESQGDNPYGLGAIEEGAARCPRCAKEMESETAVICLNCGFNIKTRTRVDKKVVYENTGGDVFKHRLPGILAVIFLIALIVFGFVLNFKVKDWAQGSFLQNEDGTFWLKPGIFGLYGTLFLVMVGLPILRFAIKRLVYEHRPVEKEIK
jgi:DNA-directed RNA polymerase subunit RPC12/RpoP